MLLRGPFRSRINAHREKVFVAGIRRGDVGICAWANSRANESIFEAHQ
jgi:hypothetical protein